MTDELTSGSDGVAPNRRRFIKTAGVGAAGVWAAPQLMSSASAGTAGSPAPATWTASLPLTCGTLTFDTPYGWNIEGAGSNRPVTVCLGVPNVQVTARVFFNTTMRGEYQFQTDGSGCGTSPALTWTDCAGGCEVHEFRVDIMRGDTGETRSLHWRFVDSEDPADCPGPQSATPPWT